MDWSLSGNALKTFARSVTCLARIGNELTLQASPSQLALHTLNSSRSAYLSIILKPSFFDTYTITGAQVQCTVLLKAVCSVLRTPLTSIDHLNVILPDPDASKVQWTLDCYNENDSSLHTQLWIDPSEEFVQYRHTGDPVDVTFAVKELKAFLSFCEGCEVDIHLYFEKAGEPILMAPKFVDDASVSNFDATLVLATMLVSQLHATTTSSEPVPAAAPPKDNVSEHPSDHTRIWSELSASATKSANGPSMRVYRERDMNTNDHGDIQRISTMHISKDGPNGRNLTTKAYPEILCLLV
ncbi:hypothetical protein L1987_54731 [Smallanthus sonchifolius]|uniref:Uncharacterized protein n=1 Tax=Smallanthus sonchifolius TaxID=185202 RepID=A0ACB9E7U2_9ASTR|nr:hypothetical protein L1987_54731 [Smallanthus sonchifolius]